MVHIQELLYLLVLALNVLVLDCISDWVQDISYFAQEAFGVLGVGLAVSGIVLENQDWLSEASYGGLVVLDMVLETLDLVVLGTVLETLDFVLEDFVRVFLDSSLSYYLWALHVLGHLLNKKMILHD